MGTWGAGIYENDSTRDYIDGIIDNISNAVRDIVKRDYTLLHAGMPQSDLFMCYIDLLNAICSRHDLHTSLPGCRGGSEMESQIHGGLGVYRRRVRSGRGLPERKGYRIEREFR